ncbi:MAG: hypothetical protein Q7T48_22005 [Cellvibrio sp.]|uniref:hypothetical protein n=1 Tax=Cellvibrio sp. TaxID=1965322 RepID=UPI00271CBA25|nr:hypothetical protein [Cellvibrio sp.]
MHTFTLTDAQILLGLSYADKGADISCVELVASCAGLSDSIPALEEFTEAFNKFLYMSVINLDGDKIALADFGLDIINRARSKAGADPQLDEFIQLVLKELSGYKLKNMCNRHVWPQEQYEQAVNAQHNNLKP